MTVTFLTTPHSDAQGARSELLYVIVGEQWSD